MQDSSVDILNMSNFLTWCSPNSEIQHKETEVTHNAASLFLSLAGYSIEPTPTAAWPFRGKNPCRPIIAVQDDLFSYRTKEGKERGLIYLSLHPMQAAIILHDLQFAMSMLNSR